MNDVEESYFHKSIRILVILILCHQTAASDMILDCIVEVLFNSIISEVLSGDSNNNLLRLPHDKSSTGVLHARGEEKEAKKEVNLHAGVLHAEEEQFVLSITPLVDYI